MAGRRDTPLHRAIAITGYAFVVIGALGLLIAPGLLVLWLFLIGFGLAALPRSFAERRRDERRDERRRDDNSE